MSSTPVNGTGDVMDTTPAKTQLESMFESWTPEETRASVVGLMIQTFKQSRDLTRLKQERKLLVSKVQQLMAYFAQILDEVSEITKSNDSLVGASSPPVTLPSGLNEITSDDALDLSVKNAEDKTGKEKKEASKRKTVSPEATSRQEKETVQNEDVPAKVVKKTKKVQEEVREEAVPSKASSLKGSFLTIHSKDLGSQEVASHSFPASKLILTVKTDKKTGEERPAYQCPNCDQQIMKPKTGPPLAQIRKHLNYYCPGNSSLRAETKKVVEESEEEEEFKKGKENDNGNGNEGKKTISKTASLNVSVMKAGLVKLTQSEVAIAAVKRMKDGKTPEKSDKEEEVTQESETTESGEETQEELTESQNWF